MVEPPPHSSPAKVVGQRVRQLRNEAGWTQAALAERAGLSVIAIGSVERAVRYPRSETLELIAGALNVTPDELLLGRAPAASDAVPMDAELAELVAFLRTQPVAVLRAVRGAAHAIARQFGRG